ncbi:MAG: hypothetical protein N2Z74_03625 [Syntrophales bacterium]|nr:hypothetical protein [Syntrophales bacterium]
METRKNLYIVLMFSVLLMLISCGGIRFSQVDPAAKNFHPRSLAVLPVDVGSYEEARGTVDMIVAGEMAGRKWFHDVVSGEQMKNLLLANEELRKAVMDYTLKLKQVNYSDADLSKKIGQIAKADAFLLVNVDYWLYTKEGGKNVAKVGMGMKLVEAATGKIMWKAGHFLNKEYSFFKPDLKDIARDVVKQMTDEMPH